jgi:anti-anti-sigma factor
MQIAERRIGSAVVLDLRGEMTYANRAQFKAAVERARQAGCRNLILNMEGVRFLDSSALGMLALISQSFKLHRGVVSLLNPQSYVREIINLANVHHLLAVYDDEQDALSGRGLPVVS